MPKQNLFLSTKLEKIVSWLIDSQHVDFTFIQLKFKCLLAMTSYQLHEIKASSDDLSSSTDILSSQSRSTNLVIDPINLLNGTTCNINSYFQPALKKAKFFTNSSISLEDNLPKNISANDSSTENVSGSSNNTFDSFCTNSTDVGLPSSHIPLLTSETDNSHRTRAKESYSTPENSDNFKNSSKNQSNICDRKTLYNGGTLYENTQEQSNSVNENKSRAKYDLKNRPLQFSRFGSQYANGSIKVSNHSTELTVATYNVLSQNLLIDNKHLYYGIDRKYLNWDYRKKSLLEEFERYQPDILALQEVYDQDYMETFEKELSKLGYKGFYKKRTGNKHDGCAIFFKKDRLSITSQKNVEYFRDIMSVLDRDNVGQLAIFQSRVQTGCHVCVANTHLLFNPKRGDVKLAQLMLLLAEADKLTNGSAMPLILCGDFNCNPHSALYSFIIKGKLKYDGLNHAMVSSHRPQFFASSSFSKANIVPTSLGINNMCQYSESTDGDSGLLRHNYNFKSAYSHPIAHLNNHRRRVSSFHQRCSETLDFIFYSSLQASRSKYDTLQVISTLELPTFSNITSAVKGLPNEFSPSDHLPLLAKFLWRP